MVPVLSGRSPSVRANLFVYFDSSADSVWRTTGVDPGSSSSSVILYAVEEKDMGNIWLEFMASSPKCYGLQLLVRCGVFHKYCYTTMKRDIILHSRYTIIWIFLKEAVLLLWSRVSCMQTAVESYWDNSKLSSSRLACRPRMFHWIKEDTIKTRLGGLFGVRVAPPSTSRTPYRQYIAIVSSVCGGGRLIFWIAILFWRLRGRPGRGFPWSPLLIEAIGAFPPLLLHGGGEGEAVFLFFLHYPRCCGFVLFDYLFWLAQRYRFPVAKSIRFV